MTANVDLESTRSWSHSLSFRGCPSKITVENSGMDQSPDIETLTDRVRHGGLQAPREYMGFGLDCSVVCVPSTSLEGGNSITIASAEEVRGNLSTLYSCYMSLYDFGRVLLASPVLLKNERGTCLQCIYLDRLLIIFPKDTTSSLLSQSMAKSLQREK